MEMMEARSCEHVCVPPTAARSRVAGA
jgi:hypothetical protein